LITVSCTGMYAPGLDIDLIKRLGLDSNIQRTCINFMGCYGAVNALKTADHICLSDNSARVLIVSVELCTLHFQNANTLDNWITNSLFSDGAAAVLVENVVKRTVNTPVLLLKKFGADIIWDGIEDMGWLIGDHGFEMKLTAKVTQVIKRNIERLTVRLLNSANLTLEDIDLFAIHPGGKGILRAVEEALPVNADANRYSYETLKYYGNMSSATILFVLEKILKTDVEAGKQILSFAFGPGISFEGMILALIS
jgi:predicted naringenin-chalcone synthase